MEWRLTITTFTLAFFVLANHSLAQVISRRNPANPKVITPGKNGIPKPVKVVAGIPAVTKNRLMPISAGTPKITRFDPGALTVITPGENEVPLPKTYVVADTGYTIQYGDTIYAPKTIAVRQRKPTPALPLRHKDAAAYNIQYLDVDQGLPSSAIFTIESDQSGNLWLGSWGTGVTRYDGTSFTTYTQNEGLIDNRVRSILRDKQGNLWIGTKNGLSRFDGQAFTNYNRSTGLVSNSIWSIAEDGQGNLWIATDHGVSRFDGKSFTNFTTAQGLCHNWVYTVFPDNNGNIWMGTNYGVSCYDGKSFTNYGIANGLPNPMVLSIMQDHSGALWFGTFGGGVARFDGTSFATYDKANGLADSRIFAMTEDERKNIWFGTFGGGLSRFDGKSFTTFGTSEGLTYNEVFAIKEDDSGNLWVGTNGGGVCRYDANSFVTYSTAEGLINNTVWAIEEDKSGNLWFGSNAGVTRFDGRSFTSYTEAEGLANNKVISILDDRNDNLWFGTSGGGVSCFDGKSFTTYSTGQGLPHVTVRSIREDSKGNIWFGTNGGGVSRFDGKSFTNFSEAQGFANNRAWAIEEDKKGDFWFGTYGSGISHYDGNSFTTFYDTATDDNNYVFSIVEDKHENLWMGTNNGVRLVTQGRDDQYHFRNFTTDVGLPNDEALSLIADDDNRIWAGTSGGIATFKVPDDPSQAPLFYSFKQNEGLLKGIDANTGAAYLDHQNRLWYGMGRALAMLDLNTFKLPETPPSIHLLGLDIQDAFLDFRQSNDSLANGRFSGMRYSGVASFYNYPLHLSLPYELDHLTFHFSATDWAAPDKLKYQYTLAGLDKGWSNLTEETKAEYRNLPHGEFTFKVRAIGAAQKWSKTLTYPFIVRPPWWLTPWSYAGYSMLAIALVTAIVKFNTYRLKVDKARLEHTVKQRTVELEVQKEEIASQAKELKTANQQLLQLNEFKEGMTGMIVHDLKNPLNGVINVPKSYAAQEQIQRMRQAGKQMLNMVLNILDVYKYEDTKMVVDKADTSLSEIAVNAIGEVNFLAEQKHITILNGIAPGITVQADGEIIERVFVNILTNAIKHTPNNGRIAISANKHTDQPSRVLLSVTDTGEGIPADHLDKVFDKFGQVSAKSSGSVRSTGLGLTFCKMAVEAHGGKIGARSPGWGTTIWFTLPLSKYAGELKLERNENGGGELALETTWLTESDKQIIEPIVLEIRKYELYDILILRKLLKQVEALESDGINAWRTALRNAIMTGNEIKYKQLIDKALKR